MSASRLTVRPGRLADLPEVEAIEIESFGDPWSDTALAAELRHDDLRLSLVAERDGRVAGYLMAWRVVDQLHVLNIAVRRDLRRAGVGTALLRAAASAAAADRLVEITLEVRRSNHAARAFYRRHGFREAGVRRGYYPDTGEDALVLTCPVASLTAADGGGRGPAGPAGPAAPARA